MTQKDSNSPDAYLLDLLWRYIRFLVQKFKVITLFTLLGILFATTFWLMNRNTPKYESEMTLFSAVVPNTVLADIVEPVGRLVTQRDYERVAGMLNITIEEASTLTSFGTEIQNAYYSIEGMEREYEKNSINVIVVTSSPEHISTIEHALLNNLDSNEFIDKKVRSKRALLDREISKIQDELSILDSLQALQLKNEPIGSYGGNSLFNMSTSTLQEGIVSLYRHKESSIYLRELVQPVIVMDSLSYGVTARDYSLLKALGIIGFFFLLGIIFVSFVQVVRLALRST